MIFSKVYQSILHFSSLKIAHYYLMVLSFLESFILPYPPPDLLLAPMVLKNKAKKYRLVTLCTISSVLGGVVGYFIGVYAYDFIVPFIEKMNYNNDLKLLKNWFDVYGIWTIALAGFSPIPYKLFTVLAGFLSMALVPFVIMSFLSRGLRFYLVAMIVEKFGDQFDVMLTKYIDRVGYAVILIAILLYFYYK